jgi:hypothetical protein
MELSEELIVKNMLQYFIRVNPFFMENFSRIRRKFKMNIKSTQEE